MSQKEKKNKLILTKLVRSWKLHKENKRKKSLFSRALKFTETVVMWVTILYILNWFVSVVLIVYAIYQTCNFSYLDTLITETSQTFRDVVGVSVIKFGVENIFKYNNFGGKVNSKDDDGGDKG